MLELYVGTSDHRIDVFSYGLVLLHMLTGVSPSDVFASAVASRVGVVHTDLVMELAAVPAVDDDVASANAQLVGVAQRCVDRQPTHRPSMLDVLRDLA